MLKIFTDLSKKIYDAFKSDGAKADTSLFNDDNASATVLLIQLKNLLGPEFLLWEPETIWLETKDTELSYINRDKVLAGCCLLLQPSFFYDWRVFGNTALAFGCEIVVPNTAPRPNSWQMAWAAYEAEVIYTIMDGGKNQHEFFPEVAAYVAAILHDEGFIKAPMFLEFAQDLLDKATQQHQELKKQLTDEAVAKHVPEESSSDPLKGQLDKLLAVRQHVIARAELTSLELAPPA